MKLIYNNFDGLDVAFQAVVSEDVRNILKSAKEKAIADRRDYPVELSDRMTVLVAESGMRGGYAFRFDTGPDGATWAVSDNDDLERWNIRASVKSLALALHGYEGVKTRLFEVLGILGAKWIGMGDGDFSTVPHRVSRVDYCADFALPAGYQPDPKRIVAHSRTSKRIIGQLDEARRGRRIEGIRIGQMPNRQVAVYDKRREILASQKPYWWNLWGLDPDTYDGSIWRVEVRAGKDELNTWHLRTFDNFEERVGDVMGSILRTMRYVKRPQSRSDSNMGRWQDDPLWHQVRQAVTQDLTGYTCGIDPKDIINLIDEQRIEQMVKQIAGSAMSLTAMRGGGAHGVSTTFRQLRDYVEYFKRYFPDDYRAKFETLKRRYQPLQYQTEKPYNTENP